MLESVLLVISSLAFLEGLYSLKGGIGFVRLFRKWHRRPPRPLPDPVTLIIPCRGIDPGLEQNLEAFFQLDHPDLELLLVTGDQSDPAVPLLQETKRRFPAVRSRIIFAGPARGRGQKVHNLLQAVRLAGAGRILAFGDSDIRPSPLWLRYLVSPLEDAEVGVSTGFRWYLPQRGNLASLLRSAWNAGATSLMKERDSYFAWGGAMALRPSTFADCRIAACWEGAVSDDLAITEGVHECGLRIPFQPHCLSFSHEDCGSRELLQWIARQLVILRVYHPRLWSLTLISQFLYSAALGGSVLLAGRHMYGGGQGTLSSTIWMVLGLSVLVYLLGCLKGWMRIRAVLEFFPEHGARLRKHRNAYVFWGPVISLLSLVSLFRSLASAEIEWRGIRYRLRSRRCTVVLGQAAGPKTGNS